MAEFVCPFAGSGRTRCPEWRCDCFIETHPDSPFDLHPEDFIVVNRCPHGTVETETVRCRECALERARGE